MKFIYALILAVITWICTQCQVQIPITEEISETITEKEESSMFVELVSMINEELSEEVEESSYIEYSFPEEVSEEYSEPTEPYVYIPQGYSETNVVSVKGGAQITVYIYNRNKTGFNKDDGALFFEDLFGLCYDKDYTGIPLAAMFAQAYTEGGAGKVGVYRMSNNLFGIKAGSNWQGMVYARDLQKTFINYLTAVKAGAKDLFRAYSSMSDSIDDYIQLIKTSNLYKSALGKSEKSYLQYLVRHGYGSEAMVSVWMNIIKLYKLKNRIQY